LGGNRGVSRLRIDVYQVDFSKVPGETLQIEIVAVAGAQHTQSPFVRRPPSHQQVGDALPMRRVQLPAVATDLVASNLFVSQPAHWFIAALEGLHLGSAVCCTQQRIKENRRDRKIAAVLPNRYQPAEVFHGPTVVSAPIIAGLQNHRADVQS
jgi:hypothetical protein